MIAKRKEHFEYDRVVQSDRLGNEDGDEIIERDAYKNSRASILRALSLAAVCVVVLLAWVVSDRGGKAEQATPSGGKENATKVGQKSAMEGEGPDESVSGGINTDEGGSESIDTNEGGSDSIDTGEDRPDAHPVFVTKATVKELHGNIPKSFYDPPTGFSPSQTCDAQGEERGYVCIGDRVGNGERLALGTAMCSHHGQYMFGMDGSGSLVWRDCFEDKERVYYEGGDGDYFFMREDASFVVCDGDSAVKWEKECKFDVHLTLRCLGKPVYDCPYLHLHSEGKLVLNWIEGGGRWKSKDASKLYPF